MCFLHEKELSIPFGSSRGFPEFRLCTAVNRMWCRLSNYRMHTDCWLRVWDVKIRCNKWYWLTGVFVPTEKTFRAGALCSLTCSKASIILINQAVVVSTHASTFNAARKSSVTMHPHELEKCFRADPKSLHTATIHSKYKTKTRSFFFPWSSSCLSHRCCERDGRVWAQNAHVCLPGFLSPHWLDKEKATSTLSGMQIWRGKWGSSQFGLFL